MAPAQHQTQRETVPAYALEGLEQELAIALPQQGQARASAQPVAQQRAPQPQARHSGEPAVRIGPFRPDPSLVAARQAEIEAEHARYNEAQNAAATQFIPPAAERPEDMQARMPRVEDFPAVAQRQLRAQHGQSGHADEDRRPRGLLARLASGLTRRDDDEAELPRGSHGHRGGADTDPRVVQSQPAAQLSTPAADFARQAQPRRMGEPTGAAGGLDARGRAVAVDQRSEDHLEIPAFLRRQSS